MNALKNTAPALESFLAYLLHYGTWIACGAIAVGLIEAFTLPNAPVISFFELGVALFIALPILRVVSMLAYFVKAGDRQFGAITALVLILILAGMLLGLQG